MFFEYFNLPMWCFVKNFVVYLTYTICVCAHLSLSYWNWHFEISCKYKHIYPIFLTEKYLSLETLDGPQFNLVYHTTLKLLICTYLLFFGFWITLMAMAYVSLGASIFVLVSLFAPSSSVCIAIHITVFFFLGFLDFCHSHYFLSIYIWFAFYILFVHCFWTAFD